MRAKIETVLVAVIAAAIPVVGICACSGSSGASNDAGTTTSSGGQVGPCGPDITLPDASYPDGIAPGACDQICAAYFNDFLLSCELRSSGPPAVIFCQFTCQ